MQLHISESNQVIENKIFSGSHYAKEKMPDGTNRGTFRTYSVLVDGNNICFKNCVFENTAGCGSEKGQALALYLDGDGIIDVALNPDFLCSESIEINSVDSIGEYSVAFTLKEKSAIYLRYRGNRSADIISIELK